MSGDCRICGREAHTRDDDGWAHPCCVTWDRRAPGEPCPACNSSIAYGRKRRRRGRARRSAGADD